MSAHASLTGRLGWTAIALGLFALAAVSLLSVVAERAHDAQAAATISVNTTTDELNSDGDCSLREAIQSANTDTAVDACSAGSGADTIDVPAGTYTLTVPGAGEVANQTGDLNILTQVTINGNGAIIQACDNGGGPCTGIDRVFDVASGGALTISRLTVSNGYSFLGGFIGGGVGGGIYNGGVFTAVDSTISHNSAGYGAAIYNMGTVDLINTTVSSNHTRDAVPGAGGGLFNRQGTVLITSSTLSSNSAVFGGGLYGSGSVTIKGTILSDNSPGNNCEGLPVSLGHNLSSDHTCAFDNSGDLNSTNPMLGPLANNGGPTQTHALLAGSPGIDAGGACPPPSEDQRGVERPRDGDSNGSFICDIGAFEAAGSLGPAATDTPTNTPTHTPTTTPQPTPTPPPAVGGISLDPSSSGHGFDVRLLLMLLLPAAAATAAVSASFARKRR
jgi:CSLREA domain-containing protein